MATVTLNNLWNFIQSMSLSASNELWLAEKLHESAVSKKRLDKEKAEETLNRLCGAWGDNADTEAMEKAIRECNSSDYERSIVSFDD